MVRRSIGTYSTPAGTSICSSSGGNSTRAWPPGPGASARGPTTTASSTYLTVSSRRCRRIVVRNRVDGSGTPWTVGGRRPPVDDTVVPGIGRVARGDRSVPGSTLEEPRPTRRGVRWLDRRRVGSRRVPRSFGGTPGPGTFGTLAGRALSGPEVPSGQRERRDEFAFVSVLAVRSPFVFACTAGSPSVGSDPPRCSTSPGGVPTPGGRSRGSSSHPF